MESNHLLDIVRLIYNMQESIRGNESITNNCTKPMLGPSETLFNTRPIMLYLCNNNPLEIEYTSDNQTLLSNTFRIEGLDNSTVTVRLLNNSNGTITSTNETATINMNCIAAIKCLQDINLTL